MMCRIANFPSWIYRSTFTLFAIGVLSACSGDMTDLKQYVEETKSKYQGNVEPLPQFEPYNNYDYAAFNHRPPFTAPTTDINEEETAGGPSPDKERRKEPLEYFPLDSLLMVGTLEQKGEIWGLIKDSDGTIHRVQPGNHAGENYGEIIRITEDSIDLLEIIPDGLGAWVEREISLSIGEQ